MTPAPSANARLSNEQGDRLAPLIEEVERLCHAALHLEQSHAAELAAIPPTSQPSARNLLHYLALRQHDVRRLQADLARLGLSSLGRAESHVLATLVAVLTALRCLAAREPAQPLHPPVTYDQGVQTLAQNADAILGARCAEHPVRIMVTMPSNAADDPGLIRRLVDAGMSVMRINCAHDGPEVWRRMVDHLRAVEAQTGKRCRVEMDLAGPKSRTADVTGDLQDSAKGPFIWLNVGDRLLLRRSERDEAAAASNREETASLPSVACTLPELLAALRPGERVAFDDGKMDGVVRSVDSRGAIVEITATRATPAKLRADKGINAPGTRFTVPALSSKDIQDLDTVVELADMVALSFVHSPDDVAQLHDELLARGDSSKAMVLKIETSRAFENLPRLLLAALQRRPTAVMVARGDLGVEVGFDRLAELQEEILWLAEAAHVPVIWATEVLDRMARRGLPSRAEVTDAAMGGRAECVMLNKGPYIVEVVRFIQSIHKRMQHHQMKKMAMLRKLDVSRL